MEGKLFTDQEANILEDIILNRRDVRGNRFINKEVTDDIIDKLIYAGLHAPSVGFSQPWEFVIVRDKDTKTAIKNSFTEENTHAGTLFTDEKNAHYKKLKLEGIVEAPVNIVAFYKPSATQVLGQTSMPEVGTYSVVCAIQNMWLMARTMNIGMGWVSILNPDKVKEIINAPAQNVLIAYLCIGYVDKFLTQPELEQLKWEKRKEKETVVIYEKYNCQPQNI